MKQYEIKYLNIEDKKERTEIIKSGSQYDAMMSVCNKSYKNVILSVIEHAGESADGIN